MMLSIYFFLQILEQFSANNLQKNSLGGVLQQSCSEIFQGVDLQLYEKRPRHRCFSVNFANFFRPYFIKHLRAAASELLQKFFSLRIVN